MIASGAEEEEEKADQKEEKANASAAPAVKDAARATTPHKISRFGVVVVGQAAVLW